MKIPLRFHQYSRWSFLWLVLAITFSPFHKAHAYLDPGTGSYAVQIVVGVVFGAAYTLRTVSRRVIGWFGKKPRKDSEIDG